MDINPEYDSLLSPNSYEDPENPQSMEISGREGMDINEQGDHLQY
jgi:hypothetical protein